MDILAGDITSEHHEWITGWNTFYKNAPMEIPTSLGLMYTTPNFTVVTGDILFLYARAMVTSPPAISRFVHFQFELDEDGDASYAILLTTSRQPADTNVGVRSSFVACEQCTAGANPAKARLRMYCDTASSYLDTIALNILIKRPKAFTDGALSAAVV